MATIYGVAAVGMVSMLLAGLSIGMFIPLVFVSGLSAMLQHSRWMWLVLQTAGLAVGIWATVNACTTLYHVGYWTGVGDCWSAPAKNQNVREL